VLDAVELVSVCRSQDNLTFCGRDVIHYPQKKLSGQNNVVCIVGKALNDGVASIDCGPRVAGDRALTLCSCLHLEQDSANPPEGVALCMAFHRNITTFLREFDVFIPVCFTARLQMLRLLAAAFSFPTMYLPRASSAQGVRGAQRFEPLAYSALCELC
jgi:hypothetical protein